MGLRYLTVKDVKRICDEIAQINEENHLDKINLPINKHVFILHFSEAIEEVTMLPSSR